MSRFTILMYHIISKSKSGQEKRYTCQPKDLYNQIRYLKKNNYNFVNLDTIARHLNNGIQVPEKTIAITLDDGFQDNYDNAFPIFKELSVPATIFLVSGTIGKTNTWMHSRGFPERPMLTWPQILEMQKQGISFGAHTVTHAKLSELDSSEITSELINSKLQIEDHLGVAVKHFAYPYGLFNDIARDLTAKAGYTTACSTRSGFNNLTTDPYALRRIEVYGNDSAAMVLRKVKLGCNDGTLINTIRYYKSRLQNRLLGS